MNIVELRRELRRYNMSKSYEFERACKYAYDQGYTVIQYNQTCKYRIMYNNYSVGVSLIKTAKGWFVV